MLRRLYLVFLCPKCGALRYAKTTQKTALCFQCGHRIPIHPAKIKILFKTKESKKAKEAIQKFKMRRGKLLKEAAKGKHKA